MSATIPKPNSPAGAGSSPSPLFGAWQPIATIPDNVDVLVTCGGICRPAVARWSVIEQCYYDGDDDDCATEPEDWPLTHWMPLPEPPPNALHELPPTCGSECAQDAHGG